MQNGLIISEFKFYYLNGQLHREDGPAVEWADGSKEWWLHGQRHRVDGPALEWTNGDKAWYYHDKELNCSCQEDFERLLKMKAFW